MELSIRWAEEADLSAVNALRAAVGQEREERRFRKDFNADLAMMVYQMYFSDRADVLVAELDGEIAGFALISYNDRPRSAYFEPQRCYHLEEFGVSPAHRRLGLATAMLDFMKKDAKDKGYPCIELQVWAYNEGARALYERAGYEPVYTRMELRLDK